MFLFRLIAGLIITPVAFGYALFSIAGTWNWWRAWVFLGVSCVATTMSTLSLLRNHKDLLAERLKPIIQRGQPLVDKFIVLPFVFSYGFLFVFIPQDVFHWHFLPKPGPLVSSIGLILFCAGWRIIFLALRENRFAAPVVKHQTDRQHSVIATGPYRVVRHPMYAGIIPWLVGTALWLESYAGVLFALVPIGLLALRILVEERFLKRKLDGYEAYAQHVPYRLIPFIW